MPQLRKDPIVGRWVIIATERARRPGNFVDPMEGQIEENPGDCPYCHLQQSPIYTARHNPSAAGKNDGDVAVAAFPGSFLSTREGWHRHTHGLYDVANGFGVHEVVVETPCHVANMANLSREQIRLVFETYALRMREIEKNTDLQYAVAYKNYGSVAGSRSIGHARSHIMATPVNPLRVKEKLDGAKDYFRTKKRCVYCDLMAQELKINKRVILETEHFVALTPFAAMFLFEILILPKEHHCDFPYALDGRAEDLAGLLKQLFQKIKVGLNNAAYNYVIHTAPFYRNRPRPDHWETIQEDFHWHIELMPRMTRFAGFEKGTGFYICSIPPESMAEYLKKIEAER